MPQSTTKGREVVSEKGASRSGWSRFRIPHKYVVYDKLHRTAVFLLFSGAIIGFIRMGMDATHHVRVRRPILKEKARIDKEAEMEAMQAEREQTLNLQQQLQEEANQLE